MEVVKEDTVGPYGLGLRYHGFLSNLATMLQDLNINTVAGKHLHSLFMYPEFKLISFVCFGLL